MRQHCDQTCSWCARQFWRWLKAREAQMWAPRTKRAERTPFNAEVVTSRLKAGQAVWDVRYGRAGTAVNVVPYVGIDGTQRCRIDFGAWTWDLDVRDVVAV